MAPTRETERCWRRRAAGRQGDRDRRLRAAALRPGRRWMRELGQRVGAHGLRRSCASATSTNARARARPPRPPQRLPPEKNERARLHTATTARSPRASSAASRLARAPGTSPSRRRCSSRATTTSRGAQRAPRASSARTVSSATTSTTPVTVAVGDRIICRRNDRCADVDNGTRGTVGASTRPRRACSSRPTPAPCARSPPPTSPSTSSTPTA